MAQEKLTDKPAITDTRKLAADVTDAPVLVMATANEREVKKVDAANALIEGVLQQNGKAGDLVPIVFGGIVPVQITAATDRSLMLITSANGLAMPCPLTSGTTYNILGTSRTKASVATEFVSVQLAPSKLRIKA